MSSWAYEFTSALALAQLEQQLNRAGPWRWTQRESYWHGEYLNTRPEAGVRVRIHDPSQALGAPAPHMHGPPFRYWAQLDVDSPDAAVRRAIDEIFRRLVSAVAATDIQDIETWD